MCIASQNFVRWSACGLFLAANLCAAELPTPLASALGHLRATDAYAWTMELQTPGAPFDYAPVKGWARASGEAWLEANVERKTLQVAAFGAQRIVKLDSEWKVPAELPPATDRRSAETGRLLEIPRPADALGALLAGATAIRREADDTYSATLSAATAAEIIRSPLKHLPKRGFTPEIKAAAASARLWLKDGAFQRYVVTATASLSLPFGTKAIAQTTVVELRTVSAVEAALSPAALSRLQAMANP